MSLRTSLSAASVLILAGAATAQAAEATPITGTEWHLAEAPEAFFVLHDAATIGGNDGCNVFHGNATLEGDTLTVGNLASTLRFCDMEVSLTGILDGTHAVAVEGDTLTLTDAQGTRWSFHAAA
ncbi:META domain-containing protein [Corynebacterium mastitidis]|uniref:META domain-containing protein n=1 Tax=Corynebacterium mastitidis TaxID=161890 RepID=A0ABU8NV49_9CORY